MIHDLRTGQNKKLDRSIPQEQIIPQRKPKGHKRVAAAGARSSSRAAAG